MSTIYALKFGVGAGVTGLENGGIQIERVGELETKDATRTRIKWYAGLALFSELGAAKLEGDLRDVGSPRILAGPSERTEESPRRSRST